MCLQNSSSRSKTLWLLRSLSFSHHFVNSIEELSGTTVMGKLRHSQVMELSQSHAIPLGVLSIQGPALFPPRLSCSQADGDAQCRKADGHPGAIPALQCPPCATPNLLLLCQQLSHGAKTRDVKCPHTLQFLHGGEEGSASLHHANQEYIVLHHRISSRTSYS